MTTLQESDTTELVRVHSITGPTYLDRGPHAGTLAHVIRLGMCNLTCDWCPVPETWNRDTLDQSVPTRTVAQLAAQLLPQLKADPFLPVLITGGEPLLSDYAILDLTDRVRGYGYDMQWMAETNGTIPPPDWWPGHIYHTVVSPKVGTRDPHRKRIIDRSLLRWVDLGKRGRVDFDFTAGKRSDVIHAHDLCTWLSLRPDDCWITPAPNTDQLRPILATAAEYGFRFHQRTP